ncbi:DUF1489 family protein [Paracoccus sp. p4-l81]|uniref:DUF1489 family protein n=1 Tax=unclassified Paracoccus (in: a-proteobacteria) TaxID=2688777 RepID=UPI0035B773F4
MGQNSLNLIKLCVGAESLADLSAWQARRFGGAQAEHVTRMWPKRGDELLDGGSLYWVIKGVVQARQRLIGLQERLGADGIARCALILDPEIVPVAATPKRAFQGWRYLSAAEAPPDLPKGRAAEPALPPALNRALADLGLR